MSWPSWEADQFMNALQMQARFVNALQTQANTVNTRAPFASRTPPTTFSQPAIDVSPSMNRFFSP